MTRATLFDSLASDLRSAVRSLWRSPGITIAATAALALGIGANTAIFSVVDGVLLRPLPYSDPEALVAINAGWGNDSDYDGPLSYPQYQDLAAQTRSLESIGGWIDSDANLSGEEGAQRVLLRVALPSLLDTLRVQPVRGRNFLPEETVGGRDRVAMIEHGLWVALFGTSEDVLGKSLRLDGVDHRIVGVLPPGFQLGPAVDVWVPLNLTEPDIQVRNAHFLSVIARCRAGVTPGRLAEDLAAVTRYQIDNYPAIYPDGSGFAIRARPYLDSMVSQVRRALYVLLGAVGFVLLIACANVASLLLARAATRESEMALRMAIGAGRGRLVRQLLLESVLLSVLGGAAGVLCALWGLDALVALSPLSLPRISEVAIDQRVLLFTAAISLLTGIAFGLAPALSASHADLHHALKEGARGMSASSARLRRALVAAEVALSLVLLVGAGLMLRSFLHLRRVDPGFRPDQAWTVRIARTLPDRTLTTEDRDRHFEFVSRTLARLAQLPGVTAAGAGNIVPLDGDGRNRIIDIEGYVPRHSADTTSAQYRIVTPGWFQALGVPLVRGRHIEDSDSPYAPKVVVINEALARQYFENEDPIGRRIRLGQLTNEFPWATIVGIVGDVRGQRLDAPVLGEMYWPVAQSPIVTRMAIVVRTSGKASELARPVRAAIAEIDPAQPVYAEQTLERLVATSLGQRRFVLTLMLAFGLTALVLAALGIYGVMTYAVAQRTREIGIRVALGARPASVLRMVLWDGAKLVAVGVGIGTTFALVLTRVTSSLLYEVSTADAATYVSVAAAVAAVGLVTMVAPVARALQIEPMRALRAE